MPRVRLVRVASGPGGAFGVLVVDGNPEAVTLERVFDERGETRPVIPAGTYRCEPTFFHAGDYPTWEVVNVPGHSRVLFHRGNFERESLGCILVARSFEGKWVGGSRLGFEAFEAAVMESGPRLPFDLEVVDASGR